MSAIDTMAAANETQLQTQLKTEKAAMTTRHLSADMMAKASSENALIQFGKAAGRHTECAELLTVIPNANPSPSLSASHHQERYLKLSSLAIALTLPHSSFANQVCALHAQGDNAQHARLCDGPARMRGGQGENGAGRGRD